MVKFDVRGNEIYFNKSVNKWLYTEDDKEVSSTYMHKKCGFCNNYQTGEGHDGCFGGSLIGVMNACCGHGNEEMAYVQFLDMTTVQGKDAKTILDVLIKQERTNSIKEYNKNGDEIIIKY